VLKDLPLAIELISDSDLEPSDFDSEPPFCQLSPTHVWKLTGTQKSGTFKLKLYSEGETTVLLTPANRLSTDKSFRFIQFGGTVPLPPEQICVRAGYGFISGVRLKNRDGSGIAGVPVTFYIPDNGTFTVETGPNGNASVQKSIVYSTLGIREFRAVAALPEGPISVKALVSVVASEAQ